MTDVSPNRIRRKFRSYFRDESSSKAFSFSAVSDFVKQRQAAIEKERSGRRAAIERKRSERHAAIRKFVGHLIPTNLGVLQNVVLWAGGILIVLRLFRPIEERVIYLHGARIISENPRIAETVNIGKTTFQCIGMAVLTGLLYFSMGKLRKK